MIEDPIRIAGGNRESAVIDELLGWMCSRIYELGRGAPTEKDLRVLGALVLRGFQVSSDPSVLSSECSPLIKVVMLYILHRFFDIEHFEIVFEETSGVWNIKRRS